MNMEIKPLRWEVWDEGAQADTPLGVLIVQEGMTDVLEMQWMAKCAGSFYPDDERVTKKLEADSVMGAILEAEGWWKDRISKCLEED